MNDLLKRTVSKELKKCRTDVDKTIVQVAEDTNISKDLISRYENGECSMSMDKFCELLEYYNLNFAIFFNRVYTNMYNDELKLKEE